VNCSLSRGGFPVIAVGRPVDGNLSSETCIERPEGLVFYVRGEYSDLSSTKIREALCSGSEIYGVHPSVEAFIREDPSLNLWRNSVGIAKLPTVVESSKIISADEVGKVEVVTPIPRRIYISLSSLLRKWDLHLLGKGPNLLPLLADSLLFFGSKRSWVFPVNESEVAESKYENSKYLGWVDIMHLHTPIRSKSLHRSIAQ
jgi:hypothetical protein